jgi:TonB family protein
MTHLDEGTIQAFLDDELPSGERAAAAAHLVACETCRRSHDELAGVASIFATGIAVLDLAPPAAPTPGRGAERRLRRLTPSLARAAGLVLLLAAAAAAAAPGSPVRQWLAGDPGPEPGPPAAETPAAPALRPPSRVPVTVVGSVRGRDDQPLAFAQIQVVGDTVASWTDEAGGFRLEGDPGASWVVRATHPGYRSAERTVVLPGSGSLGLDLQLEALPGPTADPLSRFEPFHMGYTLPALLNTDEVTGAIERAYPPHLLEAGLGGEAVLRLWLDEDGRVARSVLEASSGHRELDSLALRVSRQMRFRPARNLGETVRVIVQIPVVFSTEEAGGGAAGG